jgi:hypothetical protein
VKLADGNQLLDNCQLALRYADTHNLPSEDMSNASHCIGTVHGAADTLVWLNKIKTADGVTVEQEIRIVVLLLKVLGGPLHVLWIGHSLLHVSKVVLLDDRIGRGTGCTPVALILGNSGSRDE